MKEISSFYDDSPTKSKTRYKILDAAGEVFTDKGIESSTMVDIAHKADIAVRNLYRYYESIELLAVDTAYFVFKKYEDWGDIFGYSDMDDSKTGYHLLEDMINIIVEKYLLNRGVLSLTKFTLYFDIFISKLDKENSAFLLYTSKYVKEINEEIKEFTEAVLEKGVHDGTINIKKDEIKLYSEFIWQSLMSVVMRVDIKEYENPSINKMLVKKQAEAILDHIKK